MKSWELGQEALFDHAFLASRWRGRSKTFLSFLQKPPHLSTGFKQSKGPKVMAMASESTSTNWGDSWHPGISANMISLNHLTFLIHGLREKNR